MTAILCALLMICLAAAASAEVPVSNLYRPNTSETFKAGRLEISRLFRTCNDDVAVTGE